MIAVDDGIASGNLNIADVFFLIGAILGLIAGVMSVRSVTPAVSYATLLGWLAVGCIAFGLFLL